MSTIGILMLPETSGLNATLALAKTLQQRGHRVRYLVTQKFKEHLNRQGFECSLFALPKRDKHWTDKLPVLGFLRTDALYRNHIAAAFDAWLEQERPDAVLVDPVMWYVLDGALRRGMPVMSLSPTLASHFSWDVPPLFSRRNPAPGTPGTGERLRNLWAWMHEGAHGWMLGGLNHLLAAFGHDGLGRLRAAGGRMRWGDFGHRPDLPELVISPRELDFEAARALPERHYLGTCVDAQRQDTTFDWSWYDPAKPLAYCSLGTFVSAFPRAPAFFQAVIDAFRHREDWQLVISCGPLVEKLGQQPLPPSIRLMKSVPQLELLERSRLFLTHAGIGSVREALFYGVPMLAFPVGGDQFGLAARVAHHKLGLVGDFHKADARTVGSLVDTLLGQADIAASVQRMRRACQTQHELAACAALIEQHLQNARPTLEEDGPRPAAAKTSVG